MHPQLTPYKHREIKYDAKQQFIPAYDISTALNAAGLKSIQAIIGALLYYARAVSKKLLVALGAIGAQQPAATESTDDAIKQHLDLFASYPNDGIVYCASDMVLAAHYDAGFHNGSKLCSRTGAHIF